MNAVYCSAEQAIREIQKKKIIIIQDDENRENEGDLYIPANHATSETVNFMVSYGKGLVCIAITEKRAKQLDLPFMIDPDKNEEYTKCNFTVSVDAREGIGSGISVYDRAKTIRIVADATAKPHDLVRPGHIFPLVAREGGIRARRGHTEAAIELSVLAGYDPSGVICEILDTDGNMMRGKNLEEYAKKHDMRILKISSLIDFLQHENR